MLQAYAEKLLWLLYHNHIRQKVIYKVGEKLFDWLNKFVGN
jgi:hypothetical protein